MIFNCSVCSEEVAIPNEDIEKFKKHGWECDLCYSVIVKKRYPQNKPNAVTIFSPCSSALGDFVVESVVRERYKRDNPDENIINLGLCDADEAIRVYCPDKFFWASITNFMKKPKKTFIDRILRRKKDIIEYSVAVEADWLAKEGIYPVFEWDGAEKVEDCEKFAVLNFRNIIKVSWKNAEPYLINHTLYHLEKYINSGQIDKAYIVGNDDPDDMVYLPEWCVDYRKRIGLREIARLCALSKIFIAKDCGLPHLAAASGARNMVIWGYHEPQWIVKAPKDRFTALSKNDSTVTGIKNAIDQRMRAQ